MGKDKARKGKAGQGDGSNARLATTMAMTGGVFLLRKLLATIWTKATGRNPPTDLTDPKVTLPETLVWAAATGVIVEAARFAIVRSTMRKSLPEAAEAGAESS